MFLICSTYDKIYKPSEAVSASRAAANDARVRNNDCDTSMTLTTCKMLKTERRS
jgi:hypothetical protein